MVSALFTGKGTLFLTALLIVVFIVSAVLPGRKKFNIIIVKIASMPLHRLYLHNIPLEGLPV